MLADFLKPPDLPSRRWAGLFFVGLLVLTVGITCSVKAGAQGNHSESIYRPQSDPLPPAADTFNALQSKSVGPPETAPLIASPVEQNTREPGNSVEQGGKAERIVAAALASLARADSITARVRQRVRVGDRVLVGAGRYVQSGLGQDQRFRFETTMKSDTEEFELLEVCDSLFFWTYRRVGNLPPELERIDVRRTQERLEKLGVVDRHAVSAYLGGIQRPQALLREWFRFISVESAAIDDVAVWSIEGRWNTEKLAGILPVQAELIRSPTGMTAAQLPAGMPWSVRFSISKRELFPLRIEWLAIPGKRPVAEGFPEPIAVLEFYDVHIDDPVDASAFVYKPATEGLVDLTDTFVSQLGRLRP